jgi:hypothetical protein
MAERHIDSMEFKLEGHDWNEVTLREYVNGRRTERKYTSVPKKVVMKLLEGSKAPTVSDFECWLKESDDAKRKKEDKDLASSSDISSSWWCSD